MTPFAAALAACGLSTEEAASLFGVSASMISKKLSGVRLMTAEDGMRLRELYRRVVASDVEGLPDGAREMSRTLRMLRGEDPLPPPRSKGGRPRKAPG